MTDHGICDHCGGYGEVTRDDPDTNQFKLERCHVCQGSGLKPYPKQRKRFDSDAALHAAIDVVMTRITYPPKVQT